MKNLFFIRHAKSSWGEPNLKDIERPLNKRGKHDAPKMAAYLKEKIDFDLCLIYSSPAVRAITTAEIFHKTLEVEEPIDIQTDIYHGSESDVLDVIKSTNSSIDSVAVFGHNPIFTYLVNDFATESLDNLPTCGIVHIVMKESEWSKLDGQNASIEAMYFPKLTIY